MDSHIITEFYRDFVFPLEQPDSKVYTGIYIIGRILVKQNDAVICVYINKKDVTMYCDVINNDVTKLTKLEHALISARIVAALINHEYSPHITKLLRTINLL